MAHTRTDRDRDVANLAHAVTEARKEVACLGEDAAQLYHAGRRLKALLDRIEGLRLAMGLDPAAPDLPPFDARD